jgi:hypothetical protein
MRVYFKWWIGVFVLATLAGSIAMALSTQPTRAAGPWYVAPDGDDSNDCLGSGPTHACATINGALSKADPGDTIYVATGTYTGAGDEVVLLNKSVSLSGGWDNTFTIQDDTSTIHGEDTRRGIRVSSGVTATLEFFTVQNGFSGDGGGIGNFGILTLNSCNVSGNYTAGTGGGIYVNSGSLTLNNSAVSGNWADWTGGAGIAIVNNDSALILNNCTVSGNTSSGPGGGGGIRIVEGTATLTNSIVSSNTARYGGGVLIERGTLTLNNSAVNSNETTENVGGGGIWTERTTLILNNSTVSGNTDSVRGGGIYVTGGTVALNSSTISSNTVTGNDSSAGWGGGIYVTGGTVALNSSTVSSNTATEDYYGNDRGGGIYVDVDATVTLQNTILAKNTSTQGPDCAGSTFSTLGYNIYGNTTTYGSCLFSPGIGDLTNIDANLGPLEGSPGYHPLLFWSPAINAGNPAGCTDHLDNSLPFDQRGVARVGRCDIGAYEYEGVILQIFLPIIFRNYCPPLYFDDYSSPTSGWSIADYEYSRYEYLDGEYRILRKAEGWSGARPWPNNGPGFKGRDYIVAADVRNETGIYGSYGLIFGMSDDWTRFYTFEIFPNGTYEIWRGGYGASWRRLTNGSSGSINTGTAPNRLKVERNGSRIRAYANGQLLTSITDGTYTGQTQVGLIVTSYGEPNVDIRFDDFTVYPVTCGATATALGGAEEVPDLTGKTVGSETAEGTRSTNPN